MVINIILRDDNNKYDDMYNNVGNICHESLVGNKDYEESNITLNMSNINNGAKGVVPVCRLVFEANECEDLEYVRQKAKDMVDLFINQIKNK